MGFYAKNPVTSCRFNRNGLATTSFPTLALRSLELHRPQLIHPHRNDDDGADHKLMPIGIDGEQIHPVDDQAHDDGAEDGSPNASFSSIKGGAADRDGRKARKEQRVSDPRL